MLKSETSFLPTHGHPTFIRSRWTSTAFGSCTDTPFSRFSHCTANGDFLRRRFIECS
jgi:hypothetical protein